MRAPGAEIQLQIDVDAGAIDDVVIRSSRPIRPCAALEGRPATEVIELVPRLFAVCGAAQQVAALEAIEQAGALPAPPAPRAAARRRLVALEAAREHLGRVLWDWPRLLGRSPLKHPLGHAHRTLQETHRAVMQDGARLSGRTEEALEHAAAELERLIPQALGTPGEHLRQAADWEGLLAWLERADDAAPAAAYLRELMSREPLSWGDCGDRVDALPELEPASLADELARDTEGAFLAQPTWEGAVHETGPLSREQASPLPQELVQRWGKGVLTREVARLTELVTLPQQIRSSAQGARSWAPSPGAGLAGIDAARGRLYHWASLDAQGRIEGYRILPPTGWNFHPEGVVAAALRGAELPGGEPAESAVQRLVAAVDPCVAYEVTIRHA